MNYKKTYLLRKSVIFLGHQVSEQGIGVDPDYIRVIKDWKCPVTRKQTRTWLGKTGYYRSNLPFALLD